MEKVCKTKQLKKQKTNLGHQFMSKVCVILDI